MVSNFVEEASKLLLLVLPWGFLILACQNLRIPKETEADDSFYLLSYHLLSVLSYSPKFNILEF